MGAKLIVVVTMACLAIGVVEAQKPTPTPQMDSRGLPLPFGVQPYFKPDVPLGSGPYKALMAVEPSLPSQVTYYPANLSQLRGKRMPVVIWGNGSCLYVGNRYRQFLTEVASHGYLVIAGGPLGAIEQEVGPQSNPVVRAAGAPAVPQANAANAPGAPQERVTVPLMKAAIDWAVAQNADAASRFHDKLDLAHVVVMGHSCGGGLAVQLATRRPSRDRPRHLVQRRRPRWCARRRSRFAQEDQRSDPVDHRRRSARHCLWRRQVDVRDDRSCADVLWLAGRTAAHRHVRRERGR